MSSTTPKRAIHAAVGRASLSKAMTASEAIFDLARRVRETGFLGSLGPGGMGMADPGTVSVTGPDALEFLHSQVTNEVLGLEQGQGNASACVTRQGQLVELFTVYRLDAEEGSPRLLLLLERARVAGLLSLLGESIFSDDVTLADVSDQWKWWTVNGPTAGEVLDELWPLDQESWSNVAENTAARVTSNQGVPAPQVIRQSITGDPGFLVGFSSDSETSMALEERLQTLSLESGLLWVKEPELSSLIELLRIEAGIVRVGPDTSGRKRILPETGLEQYTVSYTKGCYLGQEVIARVRTYGSLPFSLRGLVFDSSHVEERTLLDELPEEGGKLCLSDGKIVGQMTSRAHSPAKGAIVAYAYLDKSHRTPGAELSLSIGDEPVKARVQLLPFYRSAGQDERVAAVYDRAVRDFAEGRESEALAGVEEALRLDPSFSDGYEAMGVMFGRSEKFHEAIDVFKRLEELAPGEPMVNTNLSLYFMKIGDKEAAENEAAKAMQKEMARTTGRSINEEALDRALLEQRLEDALRKKEMFGQVLEIDSEDGIALFGLGNALAVLENWSEAAETLAHAARVEPDNSAIHLAQGKALEKLGRFSEALAVYRMGMEVASRRGDLMPLGEMEHRSLLVSGREDERQE